MRQTLLISAALFGTAVVAPAFAQTSPMPSTQTPGAPAYSGGAASGSADTGSMTEEHPATRRSHHRRSPTAGTNEMGARPGHEPGVGESEPFSNRASNINQADSRSQIAPRLPSPGGGENATPDAYLRDAQRALSQNRTGAAQEALERAETAYLNNPANPAEPGGQVGSAAQQTVEQARQALGRGDRAQARQLVEQALGQRGGSMGGGGSMSGSPMGSSGSMGGGSPMGGGSRM
jgi:hypothetical protein